MEKKIIVIENFHEPIVCTDFDGNTLEFDTMSEAEQYADEMCQNGTAVEIN